jgi:pyrimidine-nucleoside phosphorylase
MRANEIIEKVRDHQELSREEIEYFVNGFTRGDIPDYQVSSWAMAVLLNGLTPRETTDLTIAMVHTGETLDLSGIVKIAVDKHSTGGVGDKTTLVVEPLVASCGLPVGKMSGRGLGFSGGTLDKVESIPGFRVDLSKEEFLKQLKDNGLVLAGQSADLAPADGILYALRDVTGTVPSIPLIATSIMSKKIAAGANAIVLDVKMGNGAFMTNLDDAKKLSNLMVDIGKLSGRKVTALISDMNQPLGEAVGNALELKEAIATLHGDGPEDFREHCLTVAAHLLVIGNICKTLAEGRQLAETAISDGRGWKKFRELVISQGGDVRYVDEPDRLAAAPVVETVKSPVNGYIQEVNAQIIGETSVTMGAGRAKKGDPIDHAVGIIVHHKVGDEVKAGDALFTIHAADAASAAAAKERILTAFSWSKTPVERLPLFYGIISTESYS